MWQAVALKWLKKLAWPLTALLALLSIFASRRAKTPKSTERAREELQDALLREIDERKRREEAEADARLEKERGNDPDSQRDDVMDRVRDRRARNDGS